MPSPANKVADDLFLKVIAPRVPPHLITRPRRCPTGTSAHGAVVAWVSAHARDDTPRLVQSLALSVRLGSRDGQVLYRAGMGFQAYRPHHVSPPHAATVTCGLLADELLQHVPSLGREAQQLHQQVH